MTNFERWLIKQAIWPGDKTDMVPHRGHSLCMLVHETDEDRPRVWIEVSSGWSGGEVKSETTTRATTSKGLAKALAMTVRRYHPEAWKVWGDSP